MFALLSKQHLLVLYGFFSSATCRDPDPFEIFSFTFATSNSDVKEDNNSTPINIQIRGYKTDADEVWKSTGLTLWRASDYLCQFQMDNLHLFQNKHILEIGAGLGLNGILAWRASCSSNSEVCITDGDSDALVHLRDNVDRNRNTEDGNDSNVGKVSCKQLIWGKETSEKFLSEIAKDQTYDVILASDIIYSPVIVEPLWETIQTLLKKPSNGEARGVFVMAYAKRKVPVSIELVCEKGEEAGFVHEMVK